MSDTTLLVSKDGFSFVVRKSATMKSAPLRQMLDKDLGFAEAAENRVFLENISGAALEKVCQYLYYYEKYRGCEVSDIPEPDFVPPELALEMLFVADFLDI